MKFHHCLFKILKKKQNVVDKELQRAIRELAPCSYFSIINVHLVDINVMKFHHCLFKFLRNQRTSGPVNAHLTLGPGIYFNAFIHVYSPRTGADNPLGTNADVNRKHLSLCPFVASLKTSSLKSDFIHVFSCFSTCI